MKRVDEFLHPGRATATVATANRKHFLATKTPEEREAPCVGAAVIHYDTAFDDIERQLWETAWLAGRDFGFADNCMIPYVDPQPPERHRMYRANEGAPDLPECRSGLHDRRGPRVIRFPVRRG